LKLHLLIAAIIFSFISVSAEPLKLGRAFYDTKHETLRFQALGEYLVSHLPESLFDSFQVYTQPETDTASFSETIRDNNVHIVQETFFTAFSYTKSTSLEPVLLVNRDGSVYNNCVLLSRKDSGLRHIRDLGGKTVSLSDIHSSPAYILFRNDLKKLGLKLKKVNGYDNDIPKDTVGFVEEKTENEAINAVFLQKSDAAALDFHEWKYNNHIADFMIEKMSVFHKTESVPGMVILLDKNLPEKVRDEIVNTMLNMQNTRKGEEVLKVFEADSFHKIDFDWKNLYSYISGEYY